MTHATAALVRASVGALTVLTLAVPAAAQQAQDLRALSLDDLASVSIATPSRLPQSRLRSPASAFVLTADEIRQSGATSIVELLRLVPGLHVARIDGNKWAVGSRGFTDRLARGMLVMIDGRAVYSPLFAGTYWEAQDLPLQDIERIEVIRGPGGALWGANAVAGIINIVRKSAAQSAGLAMRVGSGTTDHALMELTYGTSRPRLQYRVSGKLQARGSQLTMFDPGYDDGHLWQVGGRIDWQTDAGTGIVEVDGYRVLLGQRDTVATYDPPSSRTVTTRDHQDGASLLARWQTDPGNPRALQVQVYVDRTTRTEATFRDVQQIHDIDIQQGRLLGRHSLLWGAGYRLIDSATTTGGLLRFTPANRTDHLWSAFASDEIALAPGQLDLWLGTKVEHNRYSGVEWQPSGRLLWTARPTQALSASISRAVRTPSRVEHDFTSGNLANPSVPAFVRLNPNPLFAPEVLTAYELGWVSQPTPSLSWTVALFRNVHDRVMSLEASPPFVETDGGGQRVIVPVAFGNGLTGHSTGVEVTADVRPRPWWRTTVSYSHLALSLTARPDSLDAGLEELSEGIAPRHQLQVLTSLQAGRSVRLTWFLRAVGELPASRIPAYATSNVDVHWRVGPALSLFATGRNLHQPRHEEFADGSNGTAGIRRSVTVGLRWER